MKKTISILILIMIILNSGIMVFAEAGFEDVYKVDKQGNLVIEQKPVRTFMEENSIFIEKDGREFYVNFSLYKIGDDYEAMSYRNRKISGIGTTKEEAIQEFLNKYQEGVFGIAEDSFIGKDGEELHYTVYKFDSEYEAKINNRNFTYLSAKGTSEEDVAEKLISNYQKMYFGKDYFVNELGFNTSYTIYKIDDKYIIEAGGVRISSNTKENAIREFIEEYNRVMISLNWDLYLDKKSETPLFSSSIFYEIVIIILLTFILVIFIIAGLSKEDDSNECQCTCCDNCELEDCDNCNDECECCESCTIEDCECEEDCSDSESTYTITKDEKYYKDKSK